MKLIVNGSSMVPIYEQIVDQIKAMIVSGELKPDDILPSVRSLVKGSEDQRPDGQEGVRHILKRKGSRSACTARARM